jgi:CDP-diacylglycerol--glycerol-3-phosphate 3-phosphatidyltransferase
MIAMWAIYWMTIVSIISAVDYFVGFWKKIDHVSERARTRRSSVLSRRKAKREAAKQPSQAS